MLYEIYFIKHYYISIKVEYFINEPEAASPTTHVIQTLKLYQILPKNNNSANNFQYVDCAFSHRNPTFVSVRTLIPDRHKTPYHRTCY